eukprot:TRINITY_DN10915_c0_g2_i3.p1 TRINITY_DN10915_c0_g2~~TRINITY_DN10915_c0_g2_i3.p1  ORF type:complete len:335 (-),score=33.62 TRINITY_DN10915_c0_g2_i3:208-1146(-)
MRPLGDEAPRGRRAPAASEASTTAVAPAEPELAIQPATFDPRFEESVKKVLVAGATGGVGRRVVHQLKAKGVEVVCLVRDPEKAASMLPAGVTILKGDVYQYNSLMPALDGCDCVICATGANDIRDPLGPFNIDFTGTVNLVSASEKAGVRKFVLVTSIGADDPLYNPLNAFWGVLFWKKRAEEMLQRSGLDYTIIRPGGLVSDDDKRSKRRRSRGSDKKRGEGSVVMAPPGTYGIPPKKRAGSIKREKVAECAIEALVLDSASSKVVEIIAEEAAPDLSFDLLYQGVQGCVWMSPRKWNAAQKASKRRLAK